MTKRQPNTSDELGDLLAERDRIEAWLAALDARQTSTPPAVYERVKGDYSARLQALVAQLHERAGDLEEQVSKLAAKLSAVEAEQRVRADERAESELRHAVGEFAEDKWTEVSAVSDVELTRLDSRCTELTTELTRVRDLLDSARRAPSGVHVAVSDDPAAPRPTPAMMPAMTLAMTPVMTPAVTPAPSPERESPAAPAPTAAPLRPSIPAVRPRSTTPSFDELAFLSSIAADGAQPAPRPSGVAAQAPTRASRADVANPEHLTRGTTPTGLSDAMVNVPRASTELRPDTAPPVSQRDSATFLKGVQSDHSKTLKCGECGAMNLPTEWYCEKCGGELSAL